MPRNQFVELFEEKRKLLQKKATLDAQINDLEAQLQEYLVLKRKETEVELQKINKEREAYEKYVSDLFYTMRIGMHRSTPSSDAAYSALDRKKWNESTSKYRWLSFHNHAHYTPQISSVYACCNV